MVEHPDDGHITYRNEISDSVLMPLAIRINGSDAAVTEANRRLKSRILLKGVMTISKKCNSIANSVVMSNVKDY